MSWLNSTNAKEILNNLVNRFHNLVTLEDNTIIGLLFRAIYYFVFLVILASFIYLVIILIDIKILNTFKFFIVTFILTFVSEISLFTKIESNNLFIQVIKRAFLYLFIAIISLITGAVLGLEMIDSIIYCDPTDDPNLNSNSN